MPSALRLHTVTHLRFFLRSRLLLGLAIVMAVMWGLGFIPFVLAGTVGDRFDALRMVSSQVRGFAWFYTAAMGLFAFWWHTTQRTTTLILARPGRPEHWIVSIFLSAIFVAVAVHALGFLLVTGLALAWGVPFQAGFVWTALDGILESIVMISVLTGLAAALHPILSVLVVIVFSEWTFYSLDTMLLGSLTAHPSSPWLRGAEWAVRGGYSMLPMLDPFASRTSTVEETLRVTQGDWLYLGATAAYAAVVFGFWTLFTDYRLRRRALS
jgi:hypothetical protein